MCGAAYPNHHKNCAKDGALLVESKELEPGKIIRGKYRIVRLLGRGGMGTVYLAEHILLGRQRALKFISGELSQDTAFLRRFRREAQVAIELRHPNVVEVVDMDQAEDGSPYIAMEYVDGPDLRHALRAGTFPVERALHIARGVALGLGAAHAKGIIHRDVKPENILLAAPNQAPNQARNAAPETPKLLDFGIAAIQESATAVTRTHGLMLTPPYAAPEQWQGMTSEQLDGRADLYALGGVLYEMLTGQTPFHAENYEGWSRQHQTTPPLPPSTLRPNLANWQRLDALTLRLLAKDRNDRPKDVAELLGLIDMIGRAVPAFDPRLMGQATVIEPLPSQSPQSLPKRLRKWAVRILIAFTIAGLLMFWLLKTEPRRYIGIWMAEHRGAQGPDYVSIEKYANGYRDEQHMAEAVPLYDQACKGGILKSCVQLGYMYENGMNVAADASRAFTLYSKACDAGYPEGCIELADMYASGKYLAKDYSRAGMLYSKACDAGGAEGCTGIAEMYRDGTGVAKDESREAALYSKGCDLGGGYECECLGTMYENSEGVAKDESHAATLYSKGCDLGQGSACTRVGGMYIRGRGVLKNAPLAVASFSKGCDNSDLDACLYLGDSYRLGFGVEKDTEKANQIFSRYCNGGQQKACDQLTGGDMLKQIR